MASIWYLRKLELQVLLWVYLIIIVQLLSSRQGVQWLFSGGSNISQRMEAPSPRYPVCFVQISLKKTSMKLKKLGSLARGVGSTATWIRQCCYPEVTNQQIFYICARPAVVCTFTRYKVLHRSVKITQFALLGRRGVNIIFCQNILSRECHSPSPSSPIPFVCGLVELLQIRVLSTLGSCMSLE